MTKENESDSDSNAVGRVVVPSKNPPALPQLFQNIGLGAVTTKDRFSIEYADGMLKATVKRSSGKAETVQLSVAPGFKNATQFDPAQMTKQDRNALIRQRVKHSTQKAVADEFGLSQSMVNRIVSEDK